MITFINILLIIAALSVLIVIGKRNMANYYLCWECKSAVHIKHDHYYYFEPADMVLCGECCKKHNIDEYGIKKGDGQ